MKFTKADGNNRIITMDGINNRIITVAGHSQILTMLGETTMDQSHKTTVVGDMDLEMEMDMAMNTEMVMVTETIMVGATTMVGDLL